MRDPSRADPVSATAPVDKGWQQPSRRCSERGRRFFACSSGVRDALFRLSGFARDFFLSGDAVRRVFSDYRPEKGIAWPHQEERLLNGERAMTLTTRSVAFNSGVADTLFARPGRATATDAWRRGHP